MIRELDCYELVSFLCSLIGQSSKQTMQWTRTTDVATDIFFVQCNVYVNDKWC